MPSYPFALNPIIQIPCTPFSRHVSLTLDMPDNALALNREYGKRICPAWAVSLTKGISEHHHG
jgi:hypothetical protein